MIRKLKYGFILLALALASSCSQDDALTDGGGQDAPAATGETKQQKVRLLITTAPQEDIDGGTRAVPPGYEGSTMTESFDECRVTEVALFVFKRKAGSSDDFVFDAANPAVVTFDGEGKITDNGLTDIKHYSGVEGDADKASRNMKYVEGTITKEKDYEYRVFALGYNTQRTDEHPSTLNEEWDDDEEKDLILAELKDERNDFRIVDGDNKGVSATTTLSEVKLKLVQRAYSSLTHMAQFAYRQHIYDRYEKINNNITGYWVHTPEIFYGECYSEGKTDDNVIRFEDENKLTGILRRGVAKVTLNITEADGASSAGRHLCQFSLLINKLRTEVHLDSYDCFNNPEGELLLPYENDQFNLKFSSKFDDDNYDTYTATVGGDEHLDNKDFTMDFYVLPTKTQMHTRYSTNGLAHRDKQVWEAYVAVKSLSNGNQATGVIDPASSGKDFYFRRNQLYVINGTGEQLADTDLH